MELLSKYLGQLVELHVVTAKTDNDVELECAVVHEVSCVRMTDLYTLRKQWRVLMDTIRPDVVHLNGIWEPQSWIVQHEAQKRGIRVVITPHGMMEPWCVHHKAWKKKLALALYQRRSIREAECLHATTEIEKKNMLLWGEKTPIEIIPLGIGVDRIEVKKNWDKRRKILFLSRVHEKKGIEFLLEAVLRLKDRLVGWQVIIAGEGESSYVSTLKDFVQKSAIQDIVRFVGGVYNEEKWELYRSVDFFVLPTYCENFGYVIAEALATGTPVITTQETPWKALEEYHCGHWVSLSIETVTDAIDDMIGKNSKELECMGKSARRLIEMRCNSATVAQSMTELYNKILQ
jgi:Glycosyltransferase